MLLLALACIVGYVPKGELHLSLCLFNHHPPFLDTFFRYYTQVGEWVPYVVCFLLLFYRLGWATFATSCVLLSGAVTQVLKRIIDAPRPLTWFATNYPEVSLPLVDGVEMSRYFSFPSGHTTTFFAFFFALSIIIAQSKYQKTWKVFIQVLFFICAALGGYSRIYLSQHFTVDILGGMGIGLLITGLLYLLFARWENKNGGKCTFLQKNVE